MKTTISTLQSLQNKLQDSRKHGKLVDITAFEYRNARSLIKQNGYSIEGLNASAFTTESGQLRYSQIDSVIKNLDDIIVKLSNKVK